MCGIAGLFALDGSLDPRVGAALPAMTTALAHRGPDGEGRYRDGTAALGHRRLAIIDRAGGVQPMANDDGSCRIVFNGEIYNHRELRRTLEARGYRFRTTSDTEVLLRAYEEYGPGCVDRLVGMFAFAVYDARRRELLLARDRLGKKPLFYAVFDGVLHFASEIKALRRSPCWDGAIDPAALEGYLSLGYVVGPATIYRQVRKLQPGHWLRARAGSIDIRKYWDIVQCDDDRRDERTILGELEERLQTCVTDRLESEVPLGAFLSGGIDSGLVVSYMAQSGTTHVTATSVGFPGAADNELDAAALTARATGANHHVEALQPDLGAVLDPVVQAFDEPFADSSAIPTYFVSQAARRHVTVALSGDGGDETFGGYSFRYVPHARDAALRRWLPAFSAPAAQWLGRQWPRHPRLPRPLRLGALLQNLGTNEADAYYHDLCFMKPADTARLLGAGTGTDTASYAAVTDAYRACPSSCAVQRAQYADLKVYLPDDVLVKVDRMSMAHSLEVRCALLDHRLVEFAFRIPTATKLPAMRSKHLLRRIAARRLPPEVVNGKKRGFTAPVDTWMRSAVGRQCEEEVLDSASPLAGWLDMARVRTLLLQHRSGTRDHAYALWAIWMLHRWSVSQAAPLN
jgi:asparagine synthase (glutamine-hydrolysing)